jgi:hypothetical protein
VRGTELDDAGIGVWGDGDALAFYRPLSGEVWKYGCRPPIRVRVHLNHYCHVLYASASAAPVLAAIVVFALVQNTKNTGNGVVLRI